MTINNKLLAMVDDIKIFGKEKMWDIIETYYPDPKIRLEYRNRYKKALKAMERLKEDNKMQKKGKILLIVNGKDKYYSNKEGLKYLQDNNPTDKYRIAVCKDTKQKVVQVYLKDDKEWLCLHD